MSSVRHQSLSATQAEILNVTRTPMRSLPHRYYFLHGYAYGFPDLPSHCRHGGCDVRLRYLIAISVAG